MNVSIIAQSGKEANIFDEITFLQGQAKSLEEGSEEWWAVTNRLDKLYQLVDDEADARREAKFGVGL